eukprot:266061-Prymnesium_polylepis.1
MRARWHLGRNRLVDGGSIASDAGKAQTCALWTGAGNAMEKCTVDVRAGLRPFAPHTARASCVAHVRSLVRFRSLCT